MKIPRLKPGDAIEVIWIDACVHSGGGWMALDEFTGCEPLEIRTVSIFVERTDEVLKLAADYIDDEDNPMRCGRSQDIPLGCIKSVRRFENV